MATLADSLVSSTSRRLTLRKRADLVARKHRYQGQVYWVVKEPVGLNYFRFQEEEFAILEMLDGVTSLDQVKEQFEARFPPQKITVEELQQFVGTLHRSGLVIGDSQGQGRQLKKRRDERRRRELLASLGNVLSLRFKGIDPDRLLTWLYGWIGWVYKPWAVGAAVLLGLTALTLVTVEFEEFQSKLPAFHQFFTLENAFWLALAMGVTKVIHEFGHGLTCKHFGGECHEMGVMLLVLTPCLYCNVSDSWMLPSKWQRAAIGAAGMYVEMVIASVCTLIWWFSEPGLLNHVCLSTMFVCSVSTLLFNGNPLMRYDGYYILSDVLEIPNLRQKASDILNRKLGEWCLGLERPDDPFLPQRNQLAFALYSLAAVGYRWVVTFSILYFLYKVWEPYRLEVIGQIIAMFSLWGLAFQPLYSLGKFFWIPGRTDRVKKSRMFITLAVVVALLAAIIFVPLPYRVFCVFEVKPRNAVDIYVDVPGRLDQLLVKPGQKVKRGDVLAQLSDHNVELDLARYQGQLDQTQSELRNLRGFRVHNDRTANFRVPSIEKSVAALTEQVAELRIDQQRLVLKAPIDGTIIPPDEHRIPPDPGAQLPGWSGSPLDEKNLGCYLEKQQLLCHVGDPRQLDAVLVVDHTDRNFIVQGQEVELKLDELPSLTIESSVEKINDHPLPEAPRRLSNKAQGDLATKTDEAGKERPLNTSFLVRVGLPDNDELFRCGLTGRAKIHAGTRTLGQRLWRYLTQTFNFDL